MAIIITFVTVVLAFLLTNVDNSPEYFFKIISFWDKGFWELLIFAMQMMLMLVLGNILALSPFADKLINILVKNIKSTSKAVVIVSVFTMIIAYLNWGLALIFGAIITRKIGENSIVKNYKINYAIIGAAGYSGLMVWHGGLSGSAPLKVAEANHFLVDKIGVISIDKTIFSPMNIFSAVAVIIFVAAGLYFLSKKIKPTEIKLDLLSTNNHKKLLSESKKFKIDNSVIFLRIFAVFIIIDIFYKIFTIRDISVVNINFINLILLALGLWFHKNVTGFLKATSKSISSASGILIQFPLYAGIMGIMKYSGLTSVMSEFFIEISNQTTFPLFTFISSGLINMFVPSGGGQWAVQGPVIVEAAKNLHIPVQKAIMALAYGDEITNMIQPFWALPLLGITKLKAKDIFPYTLFMMLIGSVIFMLSLIIF